VIDLFAGFKAKAYESLKYFGAALMMIATLCMFSTQLAAASIIPWVIYLVANTIWGYDSYKTKNKPWLLISIGFCLQDLLLIATRL
jgi:hypothetical protein